MDKTLIYQCVILVADVKSKKEFYGVFLENTIQPSSKKHK